MLMAAVVGVVMAQTGVARGFDEQELRLMHVSRWLVRADGAAAMHFSCLRREAGLWCQAFSFTLRRPVGADPLAEVRAFTPAERKKWLDRTRADACKEKEPDRKPLERDLCACADEACVWARIVSEVDTFRNACVIDEPTQHTFQFTGPANAAQWAGDQESEDACGWHERRRLSFDEKGKLVLELARVQRGTRDDPGCDRPPPPAERWVERKDASFACQGVRLGR